MTEKIKSSSNVLHRWWLGPVVALIPSLVLVLSVAKFYPKKEFDGDKTVAALTTHFDERIPTLMDYYHIPGVIVALVQEGETAWSQAYGYADLEAGRKMTTQDYCRVESISKSVTAWGVMNLVDEGKIALDDPVAPYLKSWSFPESPFSEKNITVRQLLSNSAGMPLGTIGVHYDPEDQDIPTLREILSRDAKLQREPGQEFSYSNAGFKVLELLIEEVSGRDFTTYMTDEVLLPLGMHHSSFTWSEDFTPPVPNGYDSNGDPVPVYVYPDKAAGGLFATVGDIATFAGAGMTDFSSRGLNVMDAAAIHQLYEPVVEIHGAYGLAFEAYGLGHFIERLPTGQKSVAHGGQGSGWMTHFQSVPETGNGIVIFTNSQRSWPFFGYLLNDWAAWSGFDSAGMGAIVQGTWIAWGLIGLLFFLAFWQAWLLVRGLATGSRRLAPLSEKSRLLRSGQVFVALLLLALLWWSTSQEYFFLSAVFPIASGWLGWAVLVLALALLLSALFPAKDVPFSREQAS